MRFSVFVFIATIAFSANAQATPLTYDEAIDGDIVSLTAVLDFGANTISGTTSGGGTQILDFDFFNTALPANAFLDSINVVVTDNLAGNGAFPTEFAWNIDGVKDQLFLTGLGANTIDFGVALTMLNFVGFNGLPLDMVVDYTVTINLSQVSDVPLPAALPLFLMGLGATGFAARRKKRA